MACYTHLSTREREKILEGVSRGESRRKIGRAMGRDAATISRELRRNGASEASYSPSEAEKRAKERRGRSRRKYVLDDPSKLDYLAECLEKAWSPEQAVGWYELRYGVKPFSVPTVYRAIWSGRVDGQAKKALRNRRRNARKGKPKDRRGRIAVEHTIHQRPEEANRRERLGDFEGDTIHSRTKGGLATFVDRRSRLLLAAKVPDLTPDSFNRAAKALFDKLPPGILKTLTVDHGTEFRGFKQLELQHPGLTIYFADPYNANQRGSVENANGLLRQFFPKASSFDVISDADVLEAVSLINSRPRKIFGFRSSLDVFLSLLHFT